MHACHFWRYKMNKTYQYLLIIVSSGKYSLDLLFSKIDLFLMLDRISEEEYLELFEKLSEKKNEEVALDELED